MFLLRDVPKFEILQKQAERYPDLDISSALTCLSLLRVGSDVLAVMERHLGREGLSQGKFILLMLLSTESTRTLTPSQIADRARVTRTNITGLLDGLEKQGLVQRLPHPDDRRGLLVRLTDSGEALLQQLLPAFYRRGAQITATLTEEERKQLVSLLAKLNTDPPELHQE